MTNYEEALKKIYGKQQKDNFILIEIDYQKNILLPYEDGLKFLACLKNAEILHENYSKPKTIGPLDSSNFKTRILSRKEYEDIKVASLLGITVEELNAKVETVPT